MTDLISSQAILIVWRESFEAILILGILAAAIKKSAQLQYLKFLYTGVALGVLLSLVLMNAFSWVESALGSQTRSIFEAALFFLSATLMVQMVFWLKSHGRSLKSEYEKNMQSSISRLGGFGVMLFAALAVAREGSEIVVYIYSLSLEKSLSMGAQFLNLGLGILAALTLSWLLRMGMQFLKNSEFFRWTGYFLLISASGLATAGMGKLVSENIVGGIVEPVWNLQKHLSTENPIAQTLHFFNLTLQPSLSELLVFAAFWLVVVFLSFKNIFRFFIPMKEFT